MPSELKQAQQLRKPEIKELTDVILDETARTLTLLDQLEDKLSSVSRQEPTAVSAQATESGQSKTGLGELLNVGIDRASHINRRLVNIIDLLEV